MSINVYTAFMSTPALGAHVEILSAVDRSVLFARGTTGVVEVTPGFYEWGGAVADNDDHAFLALWDKNLGDNPQGELVQVFP